MLENWEKVKQYAQTGANSAGTAMEKYDIVLESISAKQEQLTAKTQELWSNLFPDELIINLLELGKVFMDILNWGDGLVAKLLLLATTVVVCATAFKTLKNTALLLNFKDVIKSIWSLITGLGATTTATTATTGALAGLKAVLSTLLLNPYVLAFSALIAVVAGGIAIFNKFNVTLEEQHEIAKDAQKDYQEVASELQSVNDELKTTAERIAELEGKGKLSVVEQEELEKLRTTNALLERRQHWLDLEEKRKKADTTKKAQEAWDKDFNNGSEYTSREKTRTVTWNEYGVETTLTDKALISENEYIKEQIRYYAELEKQINDLAKAEGEWNEEEYNKLTSEKDAVKQILEDIGIKIQTDYLDAYDVDDTTRQNWIDLQNTIYDALGLSKEVDDEVESLMSNDVSKIFSTYSGEVQSLSEKYEILAKAQDEYNEFGNITASTMKKIIDNGLLDYLTVENGQIKMNTKALQDEAEASKQNAIAKLNTALYTDLLAIAEGTFNEETSKIDMTSPKKELDEFAEKCGTTAGQVLTMAGAVEVFNSSTGNAISDSDERVQGVFDKYNGYITKINALTSNLSSGLYRSKSSSTSSGKSATEKAFDNIKKQFEADEITIDEYINNLTALLKKCKKGSDEYEKIKKELNAQKLDRIEKQFERGEISVDEYINKLTELRKEYKKNTEGYKELTDTINETKLDNWAKQFENGEITLQRYLDLLKEIQKQYTKGSEQYNDIASTATDAYIEAMDKGLDDIKNKINQIGDVNTAKESVKYAGLLSEQYKYTQEYIADIRKQLKSSSITAEQKVKLQEKLNDLLGEEVDIRDEIEKTVSEYYENQKEEAELQAEANKKEILFKKEMELYGEKGKELFEWETNKKIQAIEDEIELRQKEREALDEVNEREQLTNDLLEARLQLQNALNNKTTKILKKQEDGTWQYEYSANMQDVKKAQEAVKNAEKALDDYDFEQEIKELQDIADELNDNLDRLATQYEDTEFFANRDYEKEINNIEKIYGDIDKLTQKWMSVYGDDAEALEELVTANSTLEQSIIDLNTTIASKYEAVNNDGVNIGSNGVATALLNNDLIGSASLYSNVAKYNGITQGVSANNISNIGGSSTIISKVECIFPNITTTDGLQKALLDLPRLALQKK